jgi:hypothetical protein
MSPRRSKPPIPSQRLAEVTFDSEPEARRRLMNSAFCDRCGKIALRTKEDAHNYIGLLLSKRWRQPKPNEHTLAPYSCPWKKGWHVGRDSKTAELLEAKQ